jgi:sugar transferase (PEP-CTERM system associated)
LTHIEEIVVALDDGRGRLPIDALLRCRMLGVRVTERSSFLERATGRIDLDTMRPSWLIFSGGFERRPFERYAKRGFDVLFSLALLGLFAPLLAVIALAIRLDSPGPVFYRQTRVGRFGAPFSIMKFRTMVVDAERAGAQWAAERDPRITRVGHVLRRMRLDELPQAVNVLRGEMSLVGPRPERPEFVGELVEALPYYNERHNVQPGITGWAQINCPYGSSIEDTKVKLSYDLYYLKNRSLALDGIILLRTIGTVLFGDGAR